MIDGSKKCKYCHKKIPNVNDFCGNNCAELFKKCIEIEKKRTGYFLSGIGMGFIGIIIGILMQNSMIEGVGIMLMGMVVIMLPFTTPETIRIFGYVYARWIGRVLGFLLEIVGIWIAF